ncbi:hypothetical protein ACVWWD_004276 [Mesorhizobium sp. URHB0026]
MRRARPTTKADETDEFRAFWAIWMPHMHKNDGRGSARDEFFRHVEERGADPQDIVDGAAWFIRSGGQQETGYDGKLIKCHAMTWLNRGAYEDGADKERQYQAKLADRATNVVPIKPVSTYKPKFLRDWELKQQES